MQNLKHFYLKKPAFVFNKAYLWNPEMAFGTKITTVNQLTAISPIDGRYAK
jgi:hypothetical protein